MAPPSSLAIALAGRMDTETTKTTHPTNHPAHPTTTTHSTMKLRLKQHHQQPDALTSRLGTSAPVHTTKFTGGAGRALPTPPNSISPTLPPAALNNRHHVGAAATSAPGYAHHHGVLDPVDSDVDITGSSPRQGPTNNADASGAITSALLAKHHLPSILLSNGPLAIRHIMGYLTTSVPGFSSIPPTKARRIVVGALEGRGNGSEESAERGGVRFEKVGWGRWDARLSGQPARSELSLSPTLPAFGIRIEGARESNVRRPPAPSSSWTDRLSPAAEDVDVEMDMEDMDHMSLDDPCSSSSEAPSEDEIMADDSELATDDEDWAAMGAEALREASYQGSAPRTGGLGAGGHLYTGGGSVRSYSYQGSSSLVKPSPALGLRMRPGLSPMGAGVSGITNGLSFEGRQEQERRTSEKRGHSFLETSDVMEKEAVEALLKLSGSPAV